MLKKIILRKPKRRTIELDLAIIAARLEMGPVDKSRLNQRGKKNAHVDDVIEVIEGPCAKHLLTFGGKRVKRNGEHYFRTFIKHAPTGQERFEMRPFIPDDGGGKSAIQAEASAETYIRRYALISLLGLRGAEDDPDTPAKKIESKPLPSFAPKGDVVTEDMLKSKLIGNINAKAILAKYKTANGTPPTLETVKYLDQATKKALWAELNVAGDIF